MWVIAAILISFLVLGTIHAIVILPWYMSLGAIVVGGVFGYGAGWFGEWVER